MNRGKDAPKSKDIELSLSEIEEKLNDNRSRQKIRKYTKGKLLGRGGFARCYEFICQDNNKRFAAKVINKQNLTTERQKQKLRTEIKIHKSLHHNQVVAFEHNFEDSENVYILLEICKNQTLNELLRRRKTLTEIEVQCYVIQLIKGLQYLHSHKIIHRDLKLGNLFLTDKMELKIGDFGLATKLDYDGEKKKTVCGTPNYIAPEVLDGGSGHSYEVDVWAIGIIIYSLIIGKPPFETNDIKLTYKYIKGVNFRFPENAKISYTAIKLIKKILVRDPKDRPSFDEILMDDFFNQGTAIPKLLPSASLATPPSLDYIKRFMPNVDENGVSHLHEKEKIEEEQKKQAQENERNNELNKKNESQNKDNEKNEANNSTKEVSNNLEKNENEEKDKTEKLKSPEIFVTKWVDYSSKYGLGYLLNNGCIGVYFNDCTKLLLNPKTSNLSYVERQIPNEKDMVYSFSLNGAPKELQKKIIIFQNFKKYFEEEIKSDKEMEEKEKEEKEEKEEKLKMCKTSKKKVKKIEKTKTETPGNTPKGEECIFLRKWMKTKQAIIFRLSNKTIQVGFKDHTEIIFYNDIISYKNKKGGVTLMKIEEALNSSNFEMNKRIKYTQNILTKMMSINKQKENK